MRPIEAADEEFLVTVYAETRRDELAVTGWDEATKDAFVRQQFTAQHRWYMEQYQGASYDVIVVDGADAGRLYVARWPTEIRIMDIALLPAFRNRGVGTALLRSLMDEAATAVKLLSIHVERFNPALRLYERLGFQAAGEHGVYLRMEWAPIHG